MSDNRYAPPTAPVQDIPLSSQMIARPREIVWAMQLAAAGYVLGLVGIAMNWDYFSRLQSPGTLLASQALSLLFGVWLYFKIYTGRNWARITLLVMTVLGGLTIFSTFFLNLIATVPVLAKIRMVVGMCINLIVLWLLFFSRGREWFKSREA